MMPPATGFKVRVPIGQSHEGDHVNGIPADAATGVAFLRSPITEGITPPTTSFN